mmetsp:Transcript_978/g.2776  ORF Transcript_978/g.2776 Transcript_978/m.2776 type:complete len:208 (+) Transcript_978:77-700(+)
MSYLIFKRTRQGGQYHFPSGCSVRPTHSKWNHSMGQSSESQPTMSPNDTRLHRQYTGSLGSTTCSSAGPNGATPAGAAGTTTGVTAAAAAANSSRRARLAAAAAWLACACDSPPRPRFCAAPPSSNSPLARSCSSNCFSSVSSRRMCTSTSSYVWSAMATFSSAFCVATARFAFSAFNATGSSAISARFPARPSPDFLLTRLLACRT